MDTPGADQDTLATRVSAEERHIQRALARRAELQEVVTRFHEAAAHDPDLWRERGAALPAWAAAREMRDVDYELHLVYVRRSKRERAQHHARIRDAAASQMPPSDAPPDPRSPAHRWDTWAFERREGFFHAVNFLRRSPDELQARYARRVDRQGAAHLRWLLNLLTEVQPEFAREIDAVWQQRKGERAVPHVDGGAGFAPDPGLLQRWERQEAERLAIFLEPLLPE